MRRFLVCCTAALALGAFVAVSGPSASAAPPPGRGSDAAAEHQRVTEYWTPARQASAIPRDVMRPNAKPGGGGGGGTVTGATWTGGGDVVLVVGKVFFTMSGVNYVCSGSVVDTAIGTVVLTAGHCVKDGNGVWATNFSFRPAYNNGNSALGSWTATDLFTTNLWGGTTNGFDDDAGFAVVTQGAGTSLEAAIETAGNNDITIPTIRFATNSQGTQYSSFGYPAAGKYHGQTLTYCAGPLTRELDGQAGTQSIACDMTGGSSGGPWYESFTGKGDTAVVSSLNSYGYSSLNGYMFGPIFGSGEQAAFNGASTGDCPSTAPTAYRCVDYAG